MPKFMVTGDILHPGVVVIEAPDEDTLIQMLSNEPKPFLGELEVFDEMKHDAFLWDGGEIEVCNEDDY